jgi:methylated-DNA-[protein]-cysteine S-methyltransferase
MKLPPDTVLSDFSSPLGRMILAAADHQLVGVWFADQAHLPDLSAFHSDAHDPLLRLVAAQLTEYFAGQRRVFDLPLNSTTGTVFQQSVWQALQTIGYGTTQTYAALAKQIGNPKAVRALGAAVGRNPFSIIIACHRVIGTDGSLTGYAGGLSRKTALLQLEGAF